MGQYFRVNGDYNIKTKEGGTLVLDTGAAGTVSVTGNLTVAGLTTVVESQDLEVEDNIIVLNRGGGSVSGVVLQYSGIEIDRGDSSLIDRAALVFDEANPGFSTTDAAGAGSWMIATGSVLTGYSFADSNLRLRRILTDAGTDDGDLTVIGTGTGLIKVSGTTDYTQEILDRTAASDPEANDFITNKGYVDYAIINNPTFQIRATESKDSRVIIVDSGVTAGQPGSLDYYDTTFPEFTARNTTGESKVSVVVTAPTNAKHISADFFWNRVELLDLEITSTEITTRESISDTNIVIRTQGTGRLETNYAIQLEDIYVSGGTPPGNAIGAHTIYTGDSETGDTGIYFATTSNRDELISKSRALVWSLLF